MTAPERIYGWLDTQMSVARHYDGLTYQGHSYVIDMADKDKPLVRVDVLAREVKEAKAKAKAAKLANVEKQRELI
jgi:hypothetical protein